MSRPLALSLLIVALVACAEGDQSRVGVRVIESDSAGVPTYRLAHLPGWEEPGFRWDLILEYSVATEASAPGDDPLIYQPQGYTRMPSGILVVLDGWERRLVVLDPETGEVLNRFAPDGQGPGEIRSSNAAMWPADDSTLWVLDPGNVRLSRFSLAGALLEEQGVGMSGMGGFTVQRVGSGEPWSWRVFLEDPDSGVLTDSVGWFNVELGSVEFIAAMPERPATSRRNVQRNTLFDAQSWFAPVRDGVIVGRNDAGQFRLLSEDGEVRALIEVPMTQRAIDIAEEADILREFLGVAGASLQTRPLIAEAYPLYNTMWQVNDTLFALHQGHRSTPAGEPRIPEGQFVWRVFSVTGRYAGAIPFPPGVSLPFWVEDGWIVATHRDELGLASIQAFRLVPPS